MINIFNKLATFLLSKTSNNTIIAEYHKRSPNKRVDYTRQASLMSKKEIDDWKRGIASATDPTNPRRGDLMRFYQAIKLDGHTMSCVENRILPVQCAPFKLVDKDDNEDLEAKKLLEKPWFLDICMLVNQYIFEGTQLICMFDLDENGELKQVESVPQSNFIPQRGEILINEYDETGISYRDGAYKNYYFQVGGDWNLGLFSQLAMVIIAKKLGLGSWMSYIDKYGVPPIFAITERMDTTRRDELFEMLEMFRMNHFAVLQGNEKIETPQGYNVDAHNTFKSLMSDICDKEISKRILGSSGLTDEKSFVGAAEVQERILEYRHKVDKLIFKYYFNTEIKPRLVKLSPIYAPLEHLAFEYDESESLTMKELLEYTASLSQYYEFDVEELAKVTGLPITKLKTVVNGFTQEVESEKKKPELKGYSLLATAKPFDIKNKKLLYAATWDKAIDDILEKIESGNFNATDLNKDLILKTYSNLSKAAENGYGSKDYYQDKSSRKIRENLLQFSATKTYAQQKTILGMSSMFDKIEEYRKNAHNYSDKQNGIYLGVQASFVSRRAQYIRQYKDWQRDKDIYPNLKFRTMNDKDVRPAHSALEGIVKRVSDPFIVEHATPLDWRCRCWWEQTRDDVTDIDPKYNVDPQFSANPNSIEKIFNDEGSYAQEVVSNQAKAEIRKQAEMAKEYLPYNRTEKVGNNTVFVNDFADTRDLSDNLTAAKKIAKNLDYNVYIRPHINIDGYKNPELGINSENNRADLKTFSGDSKIYNFIQNGIKGAAKQGASSAVLDVSLFKENLETISNVIKGALKERNKSIKKVYVINGDDLKIITR